MDVRSYDRLVYKDVYPGIDWEIYKNKSTGGLKYDFVVHPGADASLIRLSVQDADGVSLSADGGLEMKTRLGTVKEQAPHTFCGRKEIASHFNVSGNEVRFSLGEYDHSKTLVIDPSVIWATYYGGQDLDQGIACATDGAGNSYLAGYTESTTNLANSGFQNTYSGGVDDAMLIKFSSGGTRLWATYYGGNGPDFGFGCATDPSGNVYLAGHSGSPTSIASGGFQNTKNGNTDAFLVKFSTTGARLWATYFGGPADEFGYTCATDAGGNVYLAGLTLSPSGVASNGFQNTYAGSGDAYLVKFDAGGARLWATYYGGSANDYSYVCTTDAAGNVILGGISSSTTGISSNGFQNTYGGSGDGFVAKFNSGGARLWGTYYGGTGNENLYGCSTDAAGNIYFCGTSNSPSGISTTGSFQPTLNPGNSDAYLVKLDASGARQWGTYYGGASDDVGLSCASDPAGNVYISGATSSATGIAAAGFQNTLAGQEDAYLAKFTSIGTRVWGTYFGGPQDDYGQSCAVDVNGNLIIGGYTGSTSGIAVNAFQGVYGGDVYDALMVKVSNSTIITGTVTGQLCTGTTFQVPFTATGTYLSGNVFSAQLSDASGSFASPVNVGLLVSTANSGIINGVLPAGIAAGSNYRIRVNASNPAVTGVDNGTDLVIADLPAQPGAISGATVACLGSAQPYSVPAVTGATSYSWTLPASWTGSSTTNNIVAIVGGSSGTISVTASNGCGTSAAQSLAVSVTTITIIPSVSISGPATFCSGAPNTFTATPASAGPNPTYQWKKNGQNVGTNAPTYTDPGLANGDVISVVLTSNAPCTSTTPVASNAVTANNVMPSVVPGININTNLPSLICAGQPLTLVSNIVSGGAAPQYQWYKNGMLIPGATSPTYTLNAPANGDTLQAVLISSAICPLTPTTYSNKVGLDVTPVVVPVISISANPGTTIAAGQPVTFNASVTGGGSNPVFQWKKNGQSIPFATGASYTTSNLHEGDVISATVISNAPCANPVLATSQRLDIHISTAVAATAGGQGSVQLYPNPNRGAFTIVVKGMAQREGRRVRLEIVNATGAMVYKTEVEPATVNWSVPVAADFADGVYLLRMSSEGGNTALPFTISK